MRLRITLTKDIMQTATTLPPFGPGIDPTTASTAKTLEIWETTFHDVEEFTEFVLKDAEGKEIIRQRINGF